MTLRTLLLVAGSAALVLGAAAAYAQSAPADGATPKGWGYELKDGKRVPKGERVTNADGSWREEIRQGSCLTVKEMSAAGELKVTRKCD